MTIQEAAAIRRVAVPLRSKLFRANIVRIIDDKLNKVASVTQEQLSANAWAHFFKDQFIVKGIKEAGFEYPLIQQERIITSILRGTDNLIFELPHTYGKTTALLIGMLNCIRIDIDGVPAIFFAPDEHCAYQVFEKALLLAKYTPIKISLATRSSELVADASCHIIIGTPLEVCRRIQETDKCLNQLTMICGDDADMTLPYKTVWEFINNVPWKPKIIGASTRMKAEMKRKIGGKSWSVNRLVVFGANITSLNIHCKNIEDKLNKLTLIEQALKTFALQSTPGFIRAISAPK